MNLYATAFVMKPNHLVPIVNKDILSDDTITNVTIKISGPSWRCVLKKTDSEFKTHT
jgi:hypothetical protein